MEGNRFLCLKMSALFFLARPWCKGWSQSGIVVCLAYFVAMISLCTTQISNSSLSSLCLGWGLICHKIFLNICFFLSFRSSLRTCTSDRDFLYPFAPFQAEDCCFSMLASLVVEAGRERHSSLFWFSINLRQCVPEFWLGGRKAFSLILPSFPQL